MKSRPATRFCTPSILALAVAQAFAAPVPDALPSGGRVTAGAATIAHSVGSGGARMDINQTSERAILAWQRFDIGSAAQVNFAQPSASSIALNRVLAGDASQIFGKLGANGQVWLVNPSGVVFGAGSRVDVGGLVASTLDSTDADFLAGRNVFNRNGAIGKVVNQGTLDATDGGLIALLAPEVRNEGVIGARLGNVVLAAGERVTLEAGANGRLRVAADPATIDALVDNRHLIIADGGQVVMSAQAADRLYSAVVANSGTVQARTLENRDGRILLLADMDHGEVQVGGLLDASAPTAPSPLAGEGREEGANGGVVETSAAKVSLAADHRVTTLAASGKHGTWLIDPNDYTIGAGGNITGAQLSDDLGNGNVTISTATQGTAGGNGDIFVNQAVSWSANKLTLSAERNIQLNADLNGSGTAQLMLEYGQGAVAAGNTADYSLNGGAKINLPAGANFSTKLGSDGAIKNYTVITSLGVAGDATTTTLQGMKNSVAGNYALGGDIDASATTGWNAGAGFLPVGAFDAMPCTTCFTGTFAGLGHTVNGLFVNRPTTAIVGLFGAVYSGGTLRDFGLLGGSVTGGGGLFTTGSMAGYIYQTTVRNAYASTTVTGNGSSIGGLVGDSDASVITNSFATGSVIGTGQAVGGLVGTLRFGGGVSDSYSTGTVNGSSAVGGLVGRILVSTVSSSYSTGAVSGTSSVGGLVGDDLGGSTINSSFWNITTSGQATSAGGTGKTTAELKQTVTFAGWDITNTGGSTTVWRIYENQSYPVLRAFQRDLTVTANNAAKTYDGNTYAGGNGVSYSVSGAPLAGALTYGGSAQGAVNASSYAITPGGLSFDRTSQQVYQDWGDISYANGTLTVNKAPLTVTANNANRTYDGSPYAGGNGVAYAGFVNGETSAVLGGALAYGGTSQGAINAGNYTIVPSGLAAANYTIGYANGTLTIDPAVVVVAPAPAALGVGADNKSKTYGSVDPALTWQITSGALQGGDSFSGALTRDAGENAGSYAIRQGSLSAGGNYAISFVNGVLTINKAPLTVTANGAVKTYDGLAYAGGNGVGYAGFVNGDTAAVLGGTLAWGGNAQGAINAGGYTITPAGFTSGNYTVSYANGTLTVSPAPLTVTANAAAKTYDGLVYSGGNGVDYSCLVNGETASVLGGTLAYGGSAQGAVNAGAYAITPGGLTGANYLLNFADGTLTINPAALTVTANDATKTFDGVAYGGGNGVSYAGFVQGETPAVLGGALAWDGTAQGARAIGDYAITPGGLSATNYRIGYVDGKLKIMTPPDDGSRPGGGTLVRAVAANGGVKPAETAQIRFADDAAQLTSRNEFGFLQVRADFIKLPSSDAVAASESH